MTDPTGMVPQPLGLLVEEEARLASDTPATSEDPCCISPERTEDFQQEVEGVARPERPPAVTEEAPAIVPGFEILAEIGRGGMGVVYQARDLALDRVVAVKIPSHASGLVLRKRFEREGRALAKLSHPNIVPVLSAALTGEAPYMVMEYVPGGNLAERAKEVAGTPARAVALVAQVARAVAHAHAAGIVHRDLKPSNILIDDCGQPLVTDFGVAALLAGEPVAVRVEEDTPDERPQAITRLTRSGWVIGTPAYAAPEVYDPDRFGPVGPAADIWSLGVILYELLTDRRPFPARMWGELREQVCSGAPAPAPGVGRRWRRVIDRCLVKDPACRFRSANELADALTVTGISRRWLLVGALAATATGLAGGYALLPRSEPTWPNLPAVRAAQDRLTRGEPVDLITTDRPPEVFDWATGAGSGRLISRPEEGFHVVSQSPVGCQVELLPTLPPGRYRIDAELRHDTGNGMSWVGIYAAASHCEIRRGRQHFLLTARYSDWGMTALGDPKNPRADTSRRTHLLAQYLGDSDTDEMAASMSMASHPGGQMVPAPPVGWRKVSLTIDQAAVTAAQFGTAVGVMNFKAVEEVFATACRRFSDLPAEWAVQPLGGVGVYVTSGSLAVRSFRITPLSAEE